MRTVYHFTLHAYRSWRPDHRRGYAKKEFGYLDPNEEIADMYDGRAKQPPQIFTPAIQEQMFSVIQEICRNIGWISEIVVFEPTHVHVVLSWRNYQNWARVDQRLKNLIVTMMNRARKTPGRRWFVRRASAPRRVRSKAHFDHLRNKYLPDHRGLFWKKEYPESTS